MADSRFQIPGLQIPEDAGEQAPAQFPVFDPPSAICHLESGIWNLESGIWNPPSSIPDSL
jgi:hypothetical protein